MYKANGFASTKNRIAPELIHRPCSDLNMHWFNPLLFKH
jgi:hypothetical protein